MNDSPIECQFFLPHDDFVMRHHRIHGVSVMPGATFLDIVYRILRTQGYDPARAVLRNILFTAPMATEPGHDLEVRITVGSPDGDGSRPVAADSKVAGEAGAVRDGGWRHHFSCRLEFTDEPAPGPIDPRALLAGRTGGKDMADLYRQARDEHIEHGAPMMGFGPIHQVGPGLLARLELDPGYRAQEGEFHIHPAKLDAATLVAFGQLPPPDGNPFIPVHLEEFRAPRALQGPCWIHVPGPETTAPSGDVMHSDCLIYDEQGRFVARFLKLTCKRVRNATLITRLLHDPEGTGTESRAVSAAAASPASAAPAAVASPSAAPVADSAARMGAHLQAMIGRLLGRPPGSVDTTTGFYELGLDSITMLSISADLEKLVGSRLYPTLLFEYSDIAGLARHLDETYPSAVLPEPPEQAGNTPSDGPASRGELRCFRAEWAPRPFGPSPSDVPGDLLVVTADPALPAELRRRAGAGRRTVQVSSGPEYTRTGPDAYRLRTGSRADFGRLLTELRADGVEPALLAVFPAPAAHPSTRTEDGYDAVWALAAAVSENRPAHDCRLLVLHTRPDGEEVPQHSALAALARGITAETPWLRCRSSCVDGTASVGELAALLLAEAADGRDDSETFHRRGGADGGFTRTTRQLVPYRPADPDGTELAEGAVCLIPGGAGGVGALLAEHLAATRRARILLCGRRPADAAVTALLDRCTALGAQAHYVQADITQRAGADAAVARCRELFGRVDAVLHCAGTTADGVYFRKDPAETLPVLGAKLAGTLHLDGATADCGLRLFLLFSSLSAAVPNPGQCDYSYANAFLDGFAEWRAARSDREGVSRSVAWPYWADGGMRVDPAALDRAAASGVHPMPGRDALALFERCLGDGPSRVVAVYAEPGAVRTGLLAPADAPDLVATPTHVGAGAAVPPGEARATTAHRAVGGDVAIIGLAGRYPQAPDLETFWANLAAGRDCVTEVPAERWDHEEIFDPEVGKPGRTYGRWGGFLDGVDRFDPLFFGISRREAERMDPQERLFLTIAWQCLEDAGYPPAALASEQIGVFAGVMWNDFQFVRDAGDGVAPVAMHSSIANRVSYTFDLSGPSMAVDTACSSSLTAVHLAVESIRRGESTLALAGGVNAILHPQKFLQLAQGQWLSRDGRCRAFGAGGTGYVPGEGVGAVLLKPLDRALADGDHIHGVIKASRLNHSGRTSGFTVPSPVAQAALVRSAIENAGVDTATIGYVEAHGTGTSLGDPVELEGLRRAFAALEPAPVHRTFGSVKTNIGHLESAAGVAGLTKVLLQFRHQALAPSLHADDLNPQLDFRDASLSVQREASPWPRPASGPRRAGLSAFGAGGSNAHLVLEEAPGDAGPRPPAAGPELFVLSARDEEALRARARALLAFLTPVRDDAARAERHADAVRTRVRSTVAERLGVDAGSLGGGETLEDLGLDPAGLLALAVAVAGGVDGGPADRFHAFLAPGTTVAGFADACAAEAAADSQGQLPRIDDLAHTLRVGRAAMRTRFAVVTDGLPGLRAALERLVSGEDAGPAEFRGTATTTGTGVEWDGGGQGPVGREELEKLAELWVAGAATDWSGLGARAGQSEPRRVVLPGYPFREERCWPGGWQASAALEAQSEQRPQQQPRPQPQPRPQVAAAGTDGLVSDGEGSGDMRDDDGVELCELEHGVALVRLAAPMFTDRLLRQLRDAFATIDRRPGIRAVVVTGTDAVFSMGATPEALEGLAGGRGSFTDQAFLYEGLLRCERPVVAAIQGHASGGGLAFGLYADLVVMAEEGVYSANFVNYGFTPGMGATYILERRFGAALAAEMMLTGAAMSGGELRGHGAMVTVLPRQEVLAAALDRARALADKPEAAVRRLKKELAGRVLARLGDVVASEVRMHEEVLGSEASELVRGHFARVEAFRAPAPRVASAPVSPQELAPERAAALDPPLPEPVPQTEPEAETEREPETMAAEVDEAIVTALTQVLYLQPDEIDRELTFSEMGLDSIGAVEVVRDLNQRFGTGLDAVAVYDHPTVPSLAAALLAASRQSRALHRKAVRRQPPTPSPAPAPTPAPASVPAPAPRPAAVAPPAPPPAVSAPALPAAPSAPPGMVTLRPVEAPVTVAAPSAVAPPADPPRTGGTRTGDIAVIGMSGRFPGAPDLDAFWRNLAAGRCDITEIPADRWDADRWYDPDRSVADRSDSRWAALLDGVDAFDPAFFKLSPLEAEAMDPQQRLFLQEAWKSLEDAGHAAGQEPLPRCGVFVGCGTGDYDTVLAEAGRADTTHAFLGTSPSILAARIAYLLDLRGPTLAVDTACSSSLTAVHLACESIRRGECETALAGGVAVMLTPRLHIRSSNAGMLSPTGSSAPFDASADGIVLGEGVGVVVLKPLERAVADGDHIHGVIRASGVNGDGRTNGITAPSAASQADLIRRVHSAAGVTPADIGYVEAHGTGTPLGDPIEVKALQQVFGDGESRTGFCGLGSVKGNIGHTTMAAGVAGLIKVLLALRHGQLPPSVAFTTANPEIDFERGPLRVVTELTDWRPGPSGLRVAGLSSFGFSGTNAHLVVAEAPGAGTSRTGGTAEEAAQVTTESWHLVPVSARTRGALARGLVQLADALGEGSAVPSGATLADVAYTLATGRTHFPVRAAFVVRDRAELVRELRRAAAGADDGAGPERPGELLRLAEAYVRGDDIDWPAPHAHTAVRRVPLPTYSFERGRHWAVPETPAVGTVRRRVDPSDWMVDDHQVGGLPVLPGVASLELAAEAAAAHGITGPVRVSAVRWLRPVEVTAPRELVCTATFHPAGGLRFEVTDGVDPKVPCVQGRVAAMPPGEPPAPLDIRALQERCSRRLTADRLYAAFEAAGISYGPAFRVLGEVSVAEGEDGTGTGDDALGTLLAPAGRLLHPALLDGALQTITAVTPADGEGPLVPFALESLEVFGPVGTPTYAVAARDGQRRFTVRVTDAEGRIALRFTGVALRRLSTTPSRPLPVSDLVFVPALRDAAPLPVEVTGAGGGARVWVFGADGARPLADALAAVHATAGDNVEVLPPGAVLDGAGLPDIVYWCGGEAGPEPSPVGLFRLCKALIAQGAGSRGLTLKVVLNGAVPTGDGEEVRPHDAGLLGLARTAAAEYPGWRVGCVDLGLTSNDPRAMAARLLLEPCAEPLVVLRGERRAVRVLEPLADDPRTSARTERPQPFQDNGVYLLVGGTGGIGTVLARHLASGFRARLALVGRRPLDAAVQAQLDEIEALGGQGVYLRGDITDAAATRRVVTEARERFGHIDGAFHSALVLRDRTLTSMDEATFLDVLGPKTTGAVTLAEALEDQPPRFLTYFSSAISFTDAAGQANYAAASTYEDACAAALRRRLPFPVSVVNWGFWGSVGAVADARYTERLGAFGIASLEPAEAMAALGLLLRDDIPQAVVAKGSPEGLARLGVVHGAADGPATIGTGSTAEPGLASAREGFAALERLAPVLLRHALVRREVLPEFGTTSTVAQLRTRLGCVPANERLFQALLELLRRAGTLWVDGENVGLAAEAPAGATEDGATSPLLAAHPAMRPHVELLRRCVEALPYVLDGSRNPAEVLFPKGSMASVEQVYRGQPISDHYHRVLARQAVEAVERFALAGAPAVRVLEVGAGTGAGTSFVLEALAACGRQIEYCYTDISTAFLRHGEREFGARFPFVTFRPLDIERPPTAQGFGENGYDLVLATNVLHATQDIGRTLHHVRGLLKPGGAALVNEVTRASDFLTLTFGLTPGWWAYQDTDLRLRDAPLLGPDQWGSALAAAGFGPVRTLGIAGTPERELEQCLFVAEAAPVPAAERATGPAPAPQPAGERETPARDQVRTYVRRVFAEVLKFGEEDLDDRVTFENYGVDSLVSLTVISRFEQDLGDLPATLLFERLTLAQLTDYFMTERQNELAELMRPEPGLRTEPALRTEPVVTAPAVTTPVPLPAAVSRPGDIAVIGVSGRYPGAPDLDSFWRNLASGTVSVTEVPADRWDWRPTFDAERGIPQRSYSRWGAFLDGVDRFDPAFFGILARDAANIDPQERLFLETTWNLLEEAGHLGEHTRETSTGVFVGLMYGTYGQLAATGWPSGKLSGAHSAHWSVANRVSYFFDFQGPSLAIDSACSSSLSAVHLACESIRRGECRTAVAGGVNLVLHPAHHVSLSALNMLSADGTCKVFDARADGIVPGEGVGAVLLKPLERAVADGDRIWGVIKGGSMNAGGKTGGYTVPNPNAQTSLIKDALTRAGVDPRTVSYVEAHGTGTSLGDPIETAALAQAFGTGPEDHACAVGSVKANIGHLEGAAGIAGLTKVLLQLRHGKLAPCANLEHDNPKIDFGPLRPVRRLTDWPAPSAGAPRRAGISSFGAGGANAHLVVEEYVTPQEPPAPAHPGPHLFLLSARSPEQLRHHARRVARHLTDTHGEFDVLAALAWTSQTGRKDFAERLAVVARDTAALAAELRAFADGGPERAPTTVTGHAARSAAGGGHDRAEALLRDAWTQTDMSRERALAGLAALWTEGVRIGWRDLWSAHPPQRVPFPTYPFERTRHWLDTGVVDPTLGGDRTPAAHRYLVPVHEPAPLSGPEDAPATVLLLAADPSVRRATAEAFAARGVRCVHAIPGEAFEERETDAFTLVPGDREHFRRLTDALAARDRLPDALVLACPSSPGGDGLPGPGSLADDLAAGPYSLLWAAAAVLERGRKVPLRVAVLHGPAERRPQFSALGGLLKSLALEHSTFRAVRVEHDDSGGGSTAALGALLADETVRVGEGVTEVTYRHGVRSVKRLVDRTEDAEGPGDGPDRSGDARVRAGGTYLVTGGAGALGLLSAAFLADQQPVNLVLVGRSPLDAEIERRTAALWRGGSTAWYRPTDLRDADDVTGLVDDIRARYGALNGVLHAAGVRHDSRAVRKTAVEVAEVLGPKVAGTLLLDLATRGEPLDFFAVFASLAGETGNLGQTDYAYANAFQLDFAAARERLRRSGARPGRTFAIGWPLWAEGGMAVDDATRRLFARRWSMVPMRTETGLRVFQEALSGTHTRYLVVEGATDQEPPDDIPQGMTATAPAAMPVTATERTAVEQEQSVEEIREEPVLPLAEARLRSFAAEFLMVAEDEVDLEAELMDLGFDSISLGQLIEQVNDVYGLDLLPTVLFENPTLGDLARYLDDRHGEAVRRTHRPTPQTTAEAAVTEAEVTEEDPRPVILSEAPSSSVRRDVAVIGMAARLPGSPDLEAFWRHLVAGDDLVTGPPADRTELLAHPDAASMRGGFLEGVGDFDAAFFRISPTEARQMDPQHRIFLETVWRTLEDAGYRPDELSGTSTGVFAGVATADYAELVARSGAPMQAHMATGIARSLLANRISHQLDLHGPSETVDTACSSSLVALHRAARSVAEGECSMALAGGVSLQLSPGLFTVFTQAGMLSPTGRCRTFDKDADGYVRGEGAGAVLLKPLDRAEADGDRIIAVIRGSAVNHCGKSPSLTAPNPRAQADVLVRAHQAAGISPSTVTCLETHGTGTWLGDPIEVEGAKDAFARLYAEAGDDVREAPGIAIGSVKTNIGHLEAASGIAGVLKVLLSMVHRTLPAHLHLREPNPYLRLADTPFRINDRTTEWEGAKDENGRRTWRAGVSSFGFGGTNAHVVLEAWNPPVDDPTDERTRRQPLPAARFRPQRHWFSETPGDAQDSARFADAGAPAPTGERPKVKLAPLAQADPTPAPAPATGPTPPAPPAPAGEGPGEVLPVVRALLANILGLPVDEVTDQAAFADLGLDSIFRMDLARALNDRYGLDLKGADLYEYDSSGRLAAHVATLTRPPAPPAAAAAPVVPAAPVHAVPSAADESPSSADEPQEALVRLLTDVVGHDLDPELTFEANGLSSFDMLRVVSALEKNLGTLRKTLLYDQPTVAALTEHLSDVHGAEALARVRVADAHPHAADEAPPGPAPAHDSDGGGGLADTALLPRDEALTDPELGPVIARLEAAHGKESGLAGRDIAPLVFVGAERRGFYACSRKGPAMLVWVYTGPGEHFTELAAEYFAYARRHGLRANLLSLVRLDEVGGAPVTSTPFGALQRIEDVGSFSLSGGRMSRLRYMVKRFERAGACRTDEYRSGADPAVDAELARLVDRWAATKQMVNPYVGRVRAELAGGVLDARHRIFLTHVDDTVVNAVVVTKIPSENGYLLDVEFYADDMPLGGLEYAIVAILERLGAEGCEVFSFGASFGGEQGSSPNASEQAERGLAELRSAGVFGGGNYQFKSKFRPVAQPLYLCQPAGEDATEVGDVILMIADPHPTATTAPAPAPLPAPAPHRPVAAPDADGPAVARRTAALAAHGHNPIRIAHPAVDTDLLTDSWAERSDPWQRDRLRELADSASSGAADTVATEAVGADGATASWLPFAHAFLTASGRSAEARLCASWPARRGLVLHNDLFPTWLYNLADEGFDPSTVLRAEGGTGPFTADLDTAYLEETLRRLGEKVSFVAVETAGNARGGAPLSLGNLKAVAACAAAHRVPLVLDATRLLDNAVLITAHEPGQSGRDPWDVAEEILALAAAATFSLSKDFGVDAGGLVAVRDRELAVNLDEQLLRRGREPGLSARRSLAVALGDRRAVMDLVRTRVDQVAELRARLEAGGVPLVAGTSAHCVLLDVDRLPRFDGFRHPVQACLAWLYRHTGVRGGPHLSPYGPDLPGTGAERPTRRLVRLAVPVGMDQQTLLTTADRLVALIAGPVPGTDLVEVGGPSDALGAARAHYHPAEELPTDVREALAEGRPSGSGTGNFDVLHERVPAAERHLLRLPDGEVEVFDCGTGPTVLMMPPFNMGGGVFAGQFAGLADRYRMLVVHHPGVGTTTSASDISLEGIAGLYRTVLDHLGLADPVHVVGTSFGGLLAQSFVLAHPGRAASLTLLCSSYKYANRAGEVNRLETIIEEDLDRHAAADVPGIGQRRAEYADVLSRCESMAPHIGLRYLDVFAEQPDLLGRLGDIAVPALIVAGGLDAVVPLKTSHLMHGAIPDARYRELPHAGHFPTVTDSDAVNAVLAEFLDACETRRAQR
ncbi:SDR family NAD(P)-dependent oxidoreductase [Streptomyces sp. NPDC002506]|uniref:SDR family NAD(P)-dependent oxidoreductase n=1 Tax=Streptomyces sp. NPDC002506 TaxID=3154536 RepID=UPI00331FB1B7